MSTSPLTPLIERAAAALRGDEPPELPPITVPVTVPRDESASTVTIEPGDSFVGGRDTAAGPSVRILPAGTSFNQPVRVAVPLALQTLLVFGLGYGAARVLKLSYEDAAPAAMIGASNHFEVAIATAVMLFGLGSGAALATVVGVLIEVPLMLWLVRICLRSRQRFAHDA